MSVAISKNIFFPIPPSEMAMPAAPSSVEYQKKEAQRVIQTFMPRVKELANIPNLRLIHSGPVTQLGFRKKDLKKRQLFLFNGLVVIARQLGSKWVPRWLVSLTSRKSVSSVLDSQYIVKNVEFRLYSPLRTFTLFAADPAERDAWVRQIGEETGEVKTAVDRSADHA